MEDCEINKEKGETEEKVNFKPIIIEQNGVKYVLNLEVNGDKITFSINDKEQFPSVNYIRTMSFQEIKKLNNNFNILNSFNDFYEHLKQLSNSNKLNIKKGNNKITIILYFEKLLKQQVIEIDLHKTQKDININIMEILEELINLKDKIKDI